MNKFYEVSEIAHGGMTARKGAQLRYIVIGKGRFPFDMLRYDCAYPRDNADALQVPEDATERREPRSIELSATRCTPARWSSFGWSVSSVDGVQEVLP